MAETKKVKREYRALTLLQDKKTGKLTQPGGVVDLGHLDVMAQRKMVEQGHVEEIPPGPIQRGVEGK